MTDRCIIGTRGSKLALWQAEHVKELLQKAWPQLECELRIVKTTGDVIADKPLHEIGDKAMFTKELEYALVDGDIDLCVHSMKDVATTLPPHCEISAMLQRADVRDALVCGPQLQGCTSVGELAAGARVGTGSLRRAAQLKAAYPHLEPKPIRGNVDTRLAKAYGPDYDAVILAAAGLERMGETRKVNAYLEVDEMVPAAGQGAIGIESRIGDERVARLVAAVDDAVTRRCVDAERLVLARLGGSCKVPVGVHVRQQGGTMRIDAIVLSLDGTECARACVQLPAGSGVELELAELALEELEGKGARKILASILQ